MADIFVSYASEDRGTAEALSMALEASGWTVWWDRGLVAGDEFAGVIEHELDKSSCVVVLWSNAAARSGWVAAEGQRAFDAGKVVPVRLDDRPLPLPLNMIQSPTLAQWDGRAGGPILEELQAAVLDRLDPSRLVALAPCPLFRCAAIDDWGCAAGAQDGAVRVWSLSDGRMLREFTGHGDLATAVAWNGNRLLVSGSADGTGRIWCLDDGTAVGQLVGHGGPVDDVTFDALDVVTVSADRTIRWWSTDDGRPLRSEAQSSALLSCDAAPAVGLVVAGRHDGGVSVFLDRTMDRSIDGAHHGAVYSVRLTADGTLLLTTGADSIARLWRTESGALVHTFRGHRGPVLAGAIGTNAVVTGSTDGTARIWDAESGLQMGRLGGLSGGVPGADITRSGTVVVTSAGGHVRSASLPELVSPDEATWGGHCG